LSQDDIFRVITGCVLKDLNDNVGNLNKQGWSKSGLPRAIQVLASLFRQVQDVSTEVLAAYGHQNPFSSWHALKHHLAAYVTSLGTREDPAILWKAMPSKLHATGRAVFVEYDTLNGSFSLSQAPQASPVAIDPDKIRKDAFAGCFLIFSNNNQPLTVQTLKDRLIEQGIPSIDPITVLSSCAKIVLMQAVVVEFFTKKQRGAIKLHSNYDALKDVSAGFIACVFPQKQQFTENRRKVGISATKLDGLLKTDIDSYEGLWNEMSRGSQLTRVEHHIYTLATQNLRPASELQHDMNITHAWLPTERMDPTSRALHNIQVDACVIHSDQRALATLVLAGFGIISEPYLDLINNTRTTLRQLITDLRQAEVRTDDWNRKKGICINFVSDNALPGNSRLFDFDEPDIR
jgi:hypothetical protein